MINQEELAGMVKCTKQYLNAIVNGRTDASAALAKRIGKKTGSSPALWVFGKAKDRKDAWMKFKYMGGTR